MRILIVVGARPNFMKAAPIVKALERHPHPFVRCLVHTGQHYDEQDERRRSSPISACRARTSTSASGPAAMPSRRPRS